MTAALNICFHGIGSPRRPLEPGEERYWTPVDEFQRILDVVADDPRISISFDDGNASDAEVGLPALLERNLAATFFVIAGRMDQAGSLSSDQVRHLSDRGMQIGLHGMDHRPWRGLSDSEAARELVDARDLIEDVTAAPVTDAALPLGRYDRATLARLRALGYTAVSTSDRRWGRDGDWLRPRFSVHCGDTAESIRDSVLQRNLFRQARASAAGVVKRLR